MELNGPQKTPAKSLWHVVRAVYYMALKGLWKRRAALDLNLLFKRGKIAGGRALSGLLAAHHHHHHHHHHGKTAAFDVAAFSSAFSCRSMEPANAVYAPREVEFSCSNTPSFPYFHRKARHHHRRRRDHHHRSSSSSSSSSSRRDSTLYNYDAAAIAKVFDVLNSDSSASTSTSGASDVAASSFARSPHRARQPLRVTDSPFSTAEEEEEEEEDDDDLEEDLEVGGGGVDREAENFIRWFKEQLRTQTPESEYGDHWL